MKIAAVFSSPRNNGNSCTLGTAVINGAMGLSTNMIRMYRLNSMFISRGCQHCDSCKTAEGCTSNDDLTSVINEVADCDALIVSVPMYFGHACATYRFFEDRLYSLLDSEMNPKISPGKKLITIVTCDMDYDQAERLRYDIERVYCKLFGFESLGGLVYCCNGDSDAAMNDASILREATELGMMLNPNASVPKSVVSQD